MLSFKNFFLLKTAGKKSMSWNGIKHLCKRLVQKDFKKKKTHHNQGANIFWLAHTYVH